MISCMERHEELQQALVDLLVSLDVKPEGTINLLRLGPPLVAQGNSEHEIVNTLFFMEGHRNIKLIEGNRLQVLDLSPNRRQS